MRPNTDARATGEGTPARDTAGIGRFGLRAVLGRGTVLDGGVAARLNEEVSRSSLLLSALRWVTDLGDTGIAVLGMRLALAPAVAVFGMYIAARYPTDVLAGLALGAVRVCARFLLPAPDGRRTS